jgi:glycosyltransferase involved in cell wall biosynthesis
MAYRVLMLAWEYPPHIVGGLARVVHALSHELAKQGCEVHVITSDSPGSPEHEFDGPVHVHRIKTQTDWTPDFMSSVHRMNFGILQYAIEQHRKTRFDIIHAHDWLVADAAWVLKTAFNLPLISTIHATEQGRSKGLHNDLQRHINQIEWRLIYESRQVIVNSTQMVTDLHNQLAVPSDKVTVIPNGIYADRLRSTEDPQELRRKHGFGDGPIALMVGRMVHEKGVQVLIDAAPRVLKQVPNAQFVIAGGGYYLDELRTKAAASPASAAIRFFGQANDAQLRDLYRMANVAVVPSLYEPFGIVVLEGMATGAPTVTSDVGGINDIVTHLENGVKTQAGNPTSLADGILKVMQEPELAARLRDAAYQHVLNNYTWEAIARQTLEAYRRVLAWHF